jgi:hypothetical protein
MRKCCHRSEIREIERDHADIASRFRPNIARGLFPFSYIAHAEHETRAGKSERTRSFNTYAGGRACQYRRTSTQIGRAHDFLGSSLTTEAVHKYADNWLKRQTQN